MATHPHSRYTVVCRSHLTMTFQLRKALGQGCDTLGVSQKSEGWGPRKYLELLHCGRWTRGFSTVVAGPEGSTLW
jgi:hypothetical protein